MEQNKTALQQLLEYADLSPKDNEHTSFDIRLKLVELFNIEKRQMMDAHDSGFVDGVHYQKGEHYKNHNSEDYFNSTFNNPQKQTNNE